MELVQLHHILISKYVISNCLCENISPKCVILSVDTGSSYTEVDNPQPNKDYVSRMYDQYVNDRA